jgi:opacity protein-like surface antigen
MKKIIASLLAITATSASWALTPYVGASAGYFIDTEAEFLSARVGATLAKTGPVSHHVDFEVGSMKDGYDDSFDTEIQLKPMMLNYRASLWLNERLSLYAGAGAGKTKVKLTTNAWWGAVGSFTFDISQYYNFATYQGRRSSTDSAWSGQLLGGMEFALTDSLTLNAGARFLWVDKVQHFGSNDKVGDDVAIEAGLTYRF